MKQLRGQVAIVTGASSGVGWQTAVRLAEQGVRLCVTARRAGALEQLARTIRAGGGECVVAPGDVTVAADVEQVVATTIEAYGRIDILVNDAAVQIYAPFEQLSWEEIQRVFDVSCFGYLRFARAVLPHMRRQGSGHIINVLSMLSLGAAPLLSAYTAAKHAVHGWAESLRLELHGSGIEISGVMVPSVATPMFDHAPTKLDFAPVPVPPTYDPDVAARAVVRCARRPNSRSIPVFLQGRLILWLQAVVPFVGDAIMGRFGARLQRTDQPIVRRAGNLFGPMPAGVGPRGSVAPTAAWRRALAGLSLAALATGALYGAGRVGRVATRALR